MTKDKLSNHHNVNRNIRIIFLRYGNLDLEKRTVSKYFMQQGRPIQNLQTFICLTILTLIFNAQFSGLNIDFSAN